MKQMRQGMWRGVWLVVIAALLIGCVAPPSGPPSDGVTPVVTEPAETPEPHEGRESPNCEVVDERQVVILGIEDEILAALDKLNVTYDLVEDPTSMGDIGLDDVPFNVFYLIATDDAWGVAEALRQEGISASLNYHTHMFGHSGGDSPFGRIPAPADPPLGGITGQTALRDVLTMEAADEVAPMERTIPVGVFDTAPVVGDSDTTGHDFDALAEELLADTSINPWYGAVAAPIDSRDHGIFVSALISETAPLAEIRLYRALDDSGLGDTTDILEQVRNFFRAYPLGSGEPRVLNFSLGIWCTEPYEMSKGDSEELTPFAALDLLLRTATENQSVVVAAAGNNANRLPGVGFTRPPEYPASAPFAIGVGATNLNGDLTCYTHDAKVYAPGGDGVAVLESDLLPDQTPIPPGAAEYCMPNHEACTDATCDWGLVSLSADSPTGYAYWPGTSFATPIITGLVTRYVSWTGDTTGVEAWIYDCAEDRGGLEIMRSVTQCPPL